MISFDESLRQFDEGNKSNCFNFTKTNKTIAKAPGMTQTTYQFPVYERFPHWLMISSLSFQNYITIIAVSTLRIAIFFIVTNRKVELFFGPVK